MLHKPPKVLPHLLVDCMCFFQEDSGPRDIIEANACKCARYFVLQSLKSSSASCRVNASYDKLLVDQLMIIMNHEDIRGHGNIFCSVQPHL